MLFSHFVSNFTTGVLTTVIVKFGLGARTCIGRHISMLEMSKLIPVLVKRYDFEAVDVQKAWNTKNFWFIKPVDFSVRVGHRL